jgi:omega-6 fatty acid desaturase (delta-12 desaturase)
MFESLSVSYWITLGLSIPAAGRLVRVFIIYHDCSHGSYFKTRKLRDITE